MPKGMRVQVPPRARLTWGGGVGKCEMSHTLGPSRGRGPAPTFDGLNFSIVNEANSPQEIPALVRAIPIVAGIVAISIGCLVLIGWSQDVESLKRVLPGFVAMNPGTATLFIFCGLALILRTQWSDLRVAAFVTRTLGAIVAVAALSELLEAAGVWHSAVDKTLFAAKLSNPADLLPNRMAPNTSCTFFLAGVSLLLLDPRTRRLSLSQALAVVVAFGAILPITGYLYGVTTFRGLASFIPMALHTATTFLILAGGIIFAVPDGPLAEVFLTKESRGVMARRLFPLAVLLTLSLGWLRSWGEREGFYESEFGTALFAITLSILFVLLVRWTVWTIGKLEVERNTAHARLHDLNRRKDEMIAVVSHDLCSPLTGVRMVIDMLRTDRGESKEELLNLMDHSARRMVF